jgi:hypothetical protein
MTALTEFLFPAPAPRHPVEILKWWERRRLPFNLAVGAAGTVSLVVLGLVQVLPPLSNPLEIPLGPVLLFGVMANLCYLLGPAVEIALGMIWGRAVLPTGPALYRMGLTFSVGLALLPSLLATLAWCAMTLRVLLF